MLMTRKVFPVCYWHKLDLFFSNLRTSIFHSRTSAERKGYVKCHKKVDARTELRLFNYHYQLEWLQSARRQTERQRPPPHSIAEAGRLQLDGLPVRCSYICRPVGHGGQFFSSTCILAKPSNSYVLFFSFYLCTRVLT
jgi:hypothetical protein